MFIGSEYLIKVEKIRFYFPMYYLHEYYKQISGLSETLNQSKNNFVLKEGVFSKKELCDSNGNGRNHG